MSMSLSSSHVPKVFALNRSRHDFSIFQTIHDFHTKLENVRIDRLYSFHSKFCRDLFYVRNHLPVPEIDLKTYELEIAIEDDTKKTLNIDSIKKYPKYTVTTAVMCGGNRRSEMNAVSTVL